MRKLITILIFTGLVFGQSQAQTLVEANEDKPRISSKIFNLKADLKVEELVDHKILDGPNYPINKLFQSKKELSKRVSLEENRKLAEVDFTKHQLLGIGICKGSWNPDMPLDSLKIKAGMMGSFYFEGDDEKDCQLVQYWFKVKTPGNHNLTEDPRFLLINPRCLIDEAIIQNTFQLKYALERCDLDSLPEIDYTKYLLLTRTLGGDCHANFQHDFKLDKGSKSLTWLAYNIYGGCRSANSESFFVVIPRIPADYNIHYKEILVE